MKTMFVYGTLKRGYSNHELLRGAMFIGEDEAPGRMYSAGVPVVAPDAERWVKGEVFMVPEELLPRIDQLEGHPHGYTRTPVKLRSGMEAELYYWNHDVSWREELPEGVWPPRRFHHGREAKQR